MAAQWEQQQRRGRGRRRLLLPAGLIVGGLAVALLWTPSDPHAEVPVVDATERPDEVVVAQPAAAPAPAGGDWEAVDAGPLSPRDGAVTVEVDDGVVVWGGRALGSIELLIDGAVYDPAADEWEPMPDAPISGRVGAAAVWTGNELVVWGGSAGGELLDDGAAYDADRQRWRRLPQAPLSARAGATAVYTRGRVVIWGGRTGPGRGHSADGAVYHPHRNRWSVIAPGPLRARRDPDVRAVPTADGMFVWCSDHNDALTAMYDPQSRQWRTVTTPPLDPAEPVAFAPSDGNVLAWGRARTGRKGPVALLLTTRPELWTTVAVPPLTPEPGQVLVGGEGMAATWSSRGPGLVFDALGNRWDAMVGIPRPTAVGWPAQVWAGDRLLIWHGLAKPSSVNRAVTWRPSSPWRDVPEGPVPVSNASSLLWSGWQRDQQQALVWGGIRADATNAGAAYDPELSLWETMPDAPIAGRYDHAAVFTGTQMVVLGGWDEHDRPLLDGATYVPPRRVWRSLPTPPMHVTRGSAAWSGDAVYAAGVATAGAPTSDARDAARVGSSDSRDAARAGAAGSRNATLAVAAFEERARRWRLLPPLPTAHMTGSPRVVWSGFELWVFSADTNGALHGSAWDPARRRWRQLPSLRADGRTAMTWSGSRLYVVDRHGRTASLGRGSEGWRAHPETPIGGEQVEVAFTGRRLVAYVPGSNRMASLDPRGGAWAETTPPPVGADDSARLLWSGRHLFVFSAGSAVLQGGLAHG